MNINRGDAEQRKNSAPLRLSGKKDREVPHSCKLLKMNIQFKAYSSEKNI